MKKAIEKQRFAFVLLINNHIICERFFDIKNYNEKCRESLEMKEMMDDLVGMGHNGPMGTIPAFLKKNSINESWEYYNPHREQKEEDILIKNLFEKEDFFTFQVKVDDEVVASSGFSGNYFPPKVRYQVNIKELVPDIMHDIRYYLSKKEYTKHYNGVQLNRHNKFVEAK